MYEFHTVGGLHGGPHNIESCQNWWVQAFTGVGSGTYCKQCTLVMHIHAFPNKFSEHLQLKPDSQKMLIYVAQRGFSWHLIN